MNKPCTAAILLGLAALGHPGSASAQTPTPTPLNFTVVVLPDTQRYSYTYPEIFAMQTQWVVDNKDKLNIKFVIHVGDIVSYGDQYDSEWANASASLSILEGKVPYLVIPGNHDGPPNFSKFNQYFPSSRFDGFEYYGGHYPAEGNQNNCGFLSVGGCKYLFLGLEFSPSASILDWAKSVLDAHPDRLAIVFTHDYLTTSGARSAVGRFIWNNLISRYDNIILVISGHVGPTGRRTSYIDGQPIHQVLQDFQTYPNGGDGWLRYFTFEPSASRIHVKTYSPYRDKYDQSAACEFDLYYPASRDEPDLLCEGFDHFQEGARPDGWIFQNCNADSDTYASDSSYYGTLAPALRLDEAGDAIISEEFARPAQLTFWLKGQSAAATGHMLVEEYRPGLDWSVVTDLYRPYGGPGGATYGPFALGADSARLRFDWLGNGESVAIDDIRITALITPSPTPGATPTAAPAPTAAATPALPSPTPGPEPSPLPTAEPGATATPIPGPSPSPSPAPTCGPTLPPQKAVIASGDYNGDGTADVAVFRPGTGMWSVRDLTVAYYGISTDNLAPGDYNGDGTADISVFRPSATGQWFVRNLTRAAYGQTGDISVPADYNGDLVDEMAVFRPATGRWYVRNLTSIPFGLNGDWPVPGYYDGGNAALMAVYRPGAGFWSVSGFTRFYFGGANDWPIVFDYNGDGTQNPAVFRPCEGMWGIRGITREYLGNCLDWPRPDDYDGDGLDDIAIFRDDTGLWAVKDLTRVYLGSSGDIPATRVNGE